MKKFLYTMMACVIFPIVILSFAIYIALDTLQSVCKIICLQIDKVMRWIDRNITENIR